MNSFPAMEWNAKWDWENLDIFSSKACGSPKKVHVSDWGIEGGDIDAGSYNLSGGYGGYTSDVGYVSSAKSSVSASTDCSSKEGMNASNFTFDSFGGFPGDLGKKKDLVTAEINVTSPSLETSIGSGDLLIGLKLGKRTYFENSVGNSAKTSHLPVDPVSTAPTANKIRSTCQNTTTPRCQVEGCNLDLSSAKEYHRKHRVCASHSKCPKVVVRGLERRFCQQCSRFHSLSEFDQKKRSCRRRLSDHNARRRKPQQETIQFNAASLSSSIYEGTHQMSFVLNNAPLAHTRPAGSQAWESTCRSKYKLAKGCLVKPQNAGVIDLQPHLPGSKLPYAISLPNYDTSRLLQSKGSAETFSQGFRESMLSCTDAAPDLCSARSLLSTNNSWGSCDQGSLMNVTHASMPQGLPFAPPECWQALPTNGNGGNHYQEIQFGSGFYSHSMN